jgi:hypothetical protein
MTIELSLRQRARTAHRIAMIMMGLAVVTLLTTFGILTVGSDLVTVAKPSLSTTAQTVSLSEISIRSAQAILGLIAAGAAAFVLSRAAFIELEISARMNGVADALCLAGSDSNELERLAGILVPKSKYFSLSSPEISKELGSILDIARKSTPSQQ